eukprot:m.267887 g.267887  ORF g.267887 m.267887 type:complete len:1345 (+) comp16251_c3_seq1:224-4258(+)
MPLLGKKPFVPEPPSVKLKENSNVYLCRQTGEVFADYESFAKQAILCTERVWHCGASGKTGLTFEEAAVSESLHASKLAAQFPAALEEPISQWIHGFNGTQDALTNHIFAKLKEDYFLGEVVEVVPNKNKQDIKEKKRMGTIIGIVHNDMGQKEDKAQKEDDKAKDVTDSEVTTTNVTESTSSNEPATLIGSEQNMEMKVCGEEEGGIKEDAPMFSVELFPLPQLKKKGKKGKGKKAEQDTEDVEIIPPKPEVVLVSIASLKRSRSTGLSRDIVKVFIKTNANKVEKGPWLIKESLRKRYKLSSFESQSKSRKEMEKKEEAKAAADDKAANLSNNVLLMRKLLRKKERKLNNGHRLTAKFNKELAQAVAAVKEEEKEERQRLRKIKLEEQKLETAKRNQEKLEREKAEKLALQEYMRPREDTTLDDLKDLPIPQPLETKLPWKCFGDVLAIAEMLNTFTHVLDIDETQFKDINVASIEHCFLEKRKNGYFEKSLISLLSKIFEEGGYTGSQQVLDTALKDIPLNFCSISEVLRLYLLDCGFDQEHILQFLQISSIYDLEVEDKVAVLRYMCDQVLAVSSEIDETMITCESNVRSMNSDWRDTLSKEAKERLDRKKEHRETMQSIITKFDEAFKHNKPGKTKKDTIEELKEEKRKEQNKELERFKQQEEAASKVLAALEAEHKMKILEESRVLRVTPLGLDRYHRRYFLFSTLRGIVLEPTRLSKVKEENDDVAESIVVKKDLFDNTENKEKNEEIKQNYNVDETDGKNLSNDKNETCNGESNHDTKEESAENINHVKVGESNTSIADEKENKEDPTDPTKPADDHDTWMCFDRLQDLDILTASLNKRGLREHKLKKNLISYAQLIRSSMRKADVKRKTRVIKDQQILLKEVQNKLYDLQFRLMEGGMSELQSTEEWTKKLLAAETHVIIGPLVLELEKSTPRRFLKSDYLSSASQATESAVVKQLEPKHDTESGKIGTDTGKDKDNSHHEIGAQGEKNETLLDRWRNQTQSSSSLSQLSILIDIFDKAIDWKKSAKKMKCQVCKKGTDPDKLLLCDKCDLGYHIYCLNPKLKKIPVGDWFCPTCVPAKKKSNSSKVEVEELVKSTDESSPEETSTDEAEDEDFQPRKKARKLTQKKGKQRPKRKAASDARVEMTKAARKMLDTSEEEESDKNGFESENFDPDSCGICGEPGDLVCCDMCARSCHLECVGLRRIPRGDWFCSKCEKIIKGGKFGRRSSPDLELALEIVKELQKLEQCEPFLQPVLVKDAPDYYDVVKTPMDFSKIRHNLLDLKYSTLREVLKDIKLIFKNTIEYNGVESEYADKAAFVEKFLKDKFGKRIAKLRG